MKTPQAQKESIVGYVVGGVVHSVPATSKETDDFIRDTAKQLGLSEKALIISAINHENDLNEYSELLEVDFDAFLTLVVKHYITTQKILDI